MKRQRMLAVSRDQWLQDLVLVPTLSLTNLVQAKFNLSGHPWPSGVVTTHAWPLHGMCYENFIGTNMKCFKYTTAQNYLTGREASTV